MKNKPNDQTLSELERRIKQNLINKQELIAPSPDVKKRLDVAWNALHPSTNSRSKKGFFQLQMPVYQSVAAVLIFILVGIGTSRWNDNPSKVLTKTVVKYVEKPVYIDKHVKEIQYIQIPAEDNTIKQLDANDDSLLAAADSNRIVDYSNGVSLAEDTLLQQMMVTLY